jgi:hypothetical protein
MASADVITLTFDDVDSQIGCQETWWEQGVPMSFEPAADNECGTGSCNFGADDPGKVWLWPSALAVDLSGITGITNIEVDIEDYCGGGCENLYLYAGAVIIDEDHDHEPTTMMTVRTGDAYVDLLRVNSCEAAVLEIRIYGETLVATDASSWGAVKSMYR